MKPRDSYDAVIKIDVEVTILSAHLAHYHPVVDRRTLVWASNYDRWQDARHTAAKGACARHQGIEIDLAKKYL
jgi:hypothetical protein